jgi:diguanylate cyclase (GGDEF)-like protein
LDSQNTAHRVVVVMADASGRVVAAQPSWCAYTGQDPESAAGFGWLDAIDPGDHAMVAERWITGSSQAFTLSIRVWHESSRRFRQCVGHVAPVRNEFDTTRSVAILIDELDDVPDAALAARFRRIFAANFCGIGYAEEGRFVDCNDAFLEAVGAARSDLAQGIACAEVFGARGTAVELFTDGAAREYVIRRRDGTPANLLVAAVNLMPYPGWLALTLDLTRRKAAELGIAYLALHDPLTGVPNRRLLEDRLQHALASSHRRGGTVAVLFCDVDNFKCVNDTHGHRVGDTVLQTVARRLETILRENDTVARAGGDEFVVVLGDLGDPTEATRIAERARLALGEPISIDGAELRITASLGVALNIEAGDTVETLLRRSDDAMYLAKERGRNQIAFAGDDIVSPRAYGGSEDSAP